MTEQEKIDFWKEIIYKDGKLDEEQVLKELLDYHDIMHEVSIVYCEITGNTLSKPNYKADTILPFLEDRYYDKAITQDDVMDMLKNDTIEGLKQELINYFDLSELIQGQNKSTALHHSNSKNDPGTITDEGGREIVCNTKQPII